MNRYISYYCGFLQYFAYFIYYPNDDRGKEIVNIYTTNNLNYTYIHYKLKM